MASSTTTVTITGAGGQIGYALLFRIAAGDLLGPDRPVRLRLLEIPQGVRAAEGAALELQDCAFPLLESVDVADDPVRGFDGTNIALLVGARPRGPGMERADLLKANAGIFGPQGAAIGAHAADDVRVVVVGNPANTNALIAAASAPDIPADRFTALTRLDHNRALGQLAGTLDVRPDAIADVTIWGNHSATQFPDVTHATIRQETDPAARISVVDALADVLGPSTGSGSGYGSGSGEEDAVQRWLDGEFVPRVAKRGAEIIEVRGSSSVASAANAVLDHVRDWVRGTDPARGWTSAGVMSHGEYGVPEGLISSFPVTSDGARYSIVEGLALDARARARIDASVAELVAERDTVRALGVL